MTAAEPMFNPTRERALGLRIEKSKFKIILDIQKVVSENDTSDQMLAATLSAVKIFFEYSPAIFNDSAFMQHLNGHDEGRGSPQPL
ncbi:hypothetical protein [Sulfuricystis thermophila]|uniref:hypothetical protein n=1 Tax=Sulfuricystis thermophila TaxID=2496847 RepID=UPI001559895C|nr:hypothetical protein [Sulfuricystis thermophila]